MVLLPGSSDIREWQSVWPGGGRRTHHLPRTRQQRIHLPWRCTRLCCLRSSPHQRGHVPASLTGLLSATELLSLVHLVWPDPTQPISWLTQPNPLHTRTPVFRPFFRTTQVSRYQKGKTNLDFTEARDSEWQWYQLGHMQVCTSLQTDSHASTPPLSFLQAGCPSCLPTNNIKAVKVEALNLQVEKFGPNPIQLTVL